MGYTSKPIKFGNVHWNQKEGGWAPLYKWKSLAFEGPVRPFKEFLEGECMTVLRYFMCRISEHLFDAAPLLMVVEEATGRYRFETDPAFDHIPFLIETETGWRMSDGSMALEKTSDQDKRDWMVDLVSSKKEDLLEVIVCSECHLPFAGHVKRSGGPCRACSRK